ncbi:MAG TPA: hypothetical protein VFC92_13140 [Bacteroidales bacterium]|nr:hypothetical protein [Bacteroidales bacterium]
MFKKFYLFAIAAIFFASCNNAPKDQAAEGDQMYAGETEVVMVSPDEFNANPDAFVDKNLVIEGTAVHVCKHGGKRMFIIGTDPENRIQVKAGDAISSFVETLEGSDVVIHGFVDELRIDEAYLTQWENELKADNPESDLKIHRGEEGHDHDEGDTHKEYEQIEGYRTQMAEQNVDHLSYYSIIASECKEKK